MQSFDTSSVITLLLGSAAVGALVSSLVTLAGQALERKARRRELLLAEAVRLAIATSDKFIEMARSGQPNVYLPENIRLVQTYFAGLSELIVDGSLPTGMFTNATADEQKSFQNRFTK